MALATLMPVVTEAVRMSTCLPRTMGWVLSRNSSWLGGVVLGGDDVDGLVGVDGGQARVAQLLGEVSPDDLGAVQAEDGVHNGGDHVGPHQGFGRSLRLALAGLQGGHVQVSS